MRRALLPEESLEEVLHSPEDREPPTVNERLVRVVGHDVPTKRITGRAGRLGTAGDTLFSRWSHLEPLTKRTTNNTNHTNEKRRHSFSWMVLSVFIRVIRVIRGSFCFLLAVLTSAHTRACH